MTYKASHQNTIQTFNNYQVRNHEILHWYAFENFFSKVWDFLVGPRSVLRADFRNHIHFSQSGQVFVINRS